MQTTTTIPTFKASVSYITLAAVMAQILTAESAHDQTPTIHIMDGELGKKAVFETTMGITMSFIIGTDLVLKSGEVTFLASAANLDMVEQLLYQQNPTNAGMFEDADLDQMVEISASDNGTVLSADHGIHVDDIDDTALADLLETVAKTPSFIGQLGDDTISKQIKVLAETTARVAGKTKVDDPVDA